MLDKLRKILRVQCIENVEKVFTLMRLLICDPLILEILLHYRVGPHQLTNALSTQLVIPRHVDHLDFGGLK